MKYGYWNLESTSTQSETGNRLGAGNRWTGRLVVIGTFFLSSPSFAQGNAGPKNGTQGNARAEVLFREAKAAADAGNFRTACPKFEESEKLEPAPGTLLNLADCEEHIGLFALATQHFSAAAALYRAGDERIAYAKQRATAAEKRMARLTIRLGPNAPATARVAYDGIDLAPTSLGRPLALDPGDHSILVQAPDLQPGHYAFKLAQGESRDISVQPGAPVLATAAPPSAAPPPASITPSFPSQADPYHPLPAADASSGERHGPSRAIGWVSIVVGAAGLAVGAVGGLQALSYRNTVSGHCDVDCDPEGIEAQKSLRSSATLSTIGFGVGAVGVGLGAVFLLARPLDSRTTVTAMPTRGGGVLGVGGVF